MVDPKKEIGEIPEDSDLEEPEVFYDDGRVTVRYVPTEYRFGIGVTLPGVSDGEEELIAPGQADRLAEGVPDSDVAAALEQAAGKARYATFADMVGAETLDAYLDGNITAEEFMDEFSRKTDRMLDRARDD